MSTLLDVIAHFETTLVDTIDSTSVSMELNSVSTPAGNIPAGTYGFTIEEESSSRREYVIGTISGTVVTFTARDVSPLDATTTGASSDASRQSHRKGASVKITNFPALQRITRILDGTDELDNAAPLTYDAPVTPTGGNELVTRDYVLGVVNGGAISVDTVVLAGDAGETIAARDVVFYNEADGEWYKAQANVKTDLDNTLKGIAQGAGTDGNPIAGGILIEGHDSQTTYTAGQKYYISDAGGAPATVAGTNSYVIGVGDANNKLTLVRYQRELTTDEFAALAAASTPSATNKLLTDADRKDKDDAVNAGETINGATTPVPVYQNRTDNEFYACDANDDTKYKFTGFAVTNSTDGNPITVQFNGIVSGFSGLEEGKPYYVQDVVGTIGTSRGTHSILVGVAISTTQLLIMRGKQRAHGTLSIVANGNNVITTGFKPDVVRVYAARAEDANEHGASWGVWNNDVDSAVKWYNNADAADSDDGVTGFVYELVRADGGANAGRGNITTITDTGFTLNVSNYGAAHSVIWEAEGDF